MFAVMRGAFECLWIVGKFEVIDLEIWFAAWISCWSVLVCPPVRTIFPFVVHLAEEMWTCRWDESLRDSFMVLLRICEGGRSVSGSLVTM